MRAQEDIVFLEPLGNIKRAYVGYSQTGVDRKVDEDLRVLSVPGTVARTRAELRKNSVAGYVDPFEFLVVEGRFGV